MPDDPRFPHRPTLTPSGPAATAPISPAISHVYGADPMNPLAIRSNEALRQWAAEDPSVVESAVERALRRVGRFLGMADGPTGLDYALPGGAVVGAVQRSAGSEIAGALRKAADRLLPGRGFYSRVEAVADQIPAKGVHPNRLASMLKSGASGEEVAYRRVPEFLASMGDRPVTPAAFRAHLEAHPAPRVQPKTLERLPTDVSEAYLAARRRRSELDDAVVALMNARLDLGAITQTQYANATWWAREAAQGDTRAAALLRNTVASDGAYERLLAWGKAANEEAAQRKIVESHATPHYADPRWQLPGGEGYRETLLHLDRGPVPLDVFRRQYLDFDPAASDDVIQRAYQRYVQGDSPITVRRPEVFEGPHFGALGRDLLAHTRSTRRELAEPSAPVGGPAGVFLEEVQSDWHQAGKRKGYGPITPEARAAALARNEAAEDLADVDLDFDKGVPDAPFKESWPDLAVKHQLIEAANDPSVSWIGWTPGHVQADRYRLRSVVDELSLVQEANGRMYLVGAKDGRTVDRMRNLEVTPETLTQYVGKPVAEQLLAQPARPGANGRTRRRLELTEAIDVGGKGMRQFYDDVLPKRVEKIVKPFGGTVERAPVKASDWPEPVTAGDRAAAASRARLGAESGSSVSAWIVRLPPELKEQIRKAGLPLMTIPLAVAHARDGAEAPEQK